LSGVLSTFTAAHRGGSGPPLVCLHGFTDTWRTWDLVLDRLERHHDVLAPTLAGHAGGPALPATLTIGSLADAVERAMDGAGFGTAHLAGNSLGGYVALQLAARGRADSVVALAPAGGWAEDDVAFRDHLLVHFPAMQQQVRAAMPNAGALLSTAEGRRLATRIITTNYEHIPAELLAHQMGGVAGCDVLPLVELAGREGYPLDAAKIDCPVRIVWGTEDRLVPWPSAAVRFRDHLLPHADWVELDGIGHCPQLDVPLETAQLILGFTGAV
jgi:pimeloyl-ACP methyl ester carboxylesterase